LLANALHFGSDLVGTLAVLAGLCAVALGFPGGDSIAALFVAALVIAAASRLLRRNVHVLMDRAPVDAEESARRAIAELDPPVELRRLRVREAGGAHFADVVIGIAPGAAVGQGHAAADRVEEALRERLPDADVVVHVEPGEAEAETRERVLAAALGVPQVREIHNLSVLEVDGRVEVSLHLKLPGDLPLERAHEIAEEVEHAILTAVPEIESVRTHLEPIAEAAEAQEVAVEADVVERVVREETGAAPRELRFVRTDDGIVVFLTVALEGGGSLAAAHDRASAVEKRVRTALPGISDVVVHTEP
jgi:divalent metal cation (Fe/Co/Zn/Cd) transporter